MKLVRQALSLELAQDGINAVGNNERGTFMPLRQKVTHRAVE